MKHPPFTRREFFKSAAVTGTALAFPTIVLPSSWAAVRREPDHDGVDRDGLMMRSHQNIMLGRDEVQVLAVCDVDRGKRERAKEQVEKSLRRKAGQRHLQRLRRLQRI